MGLIISQKIKKIKMIKLKEDSTHNGTIEFTSSENAFIKIEDARIFIFKKNTLNALNQDKVKVKIIIKNNKVEAEVIEVIERYRTQFVGKVHINKKLTFVISDSQKIPVDFYIKGDHDAIDGQKVLVELIDWEPGTKSPKGKILEVIGNSGEHNTEMNSIMYEYGLPNSFPLMVEADAALISTIITDEEISKRRDFRNIPTFTIDPKDAKDFDDALSVNIIGDNIEVGIHIADVSHYIKEGTDLEDEAAKRATSVYLVDRCVPMLPEILSNGVCSLKPNEDKLCFSVVVTLNKEGDILTKWFGKTIIHSDRRFSYEEAQDIIEGSKGDYENEIHILDTTAKKMRKKRIKEGSIEMGGIEVKFKLDPITKKPTGVYFKEQKDANKLIEEYMLLANKLVARELSDAKYHNVYRIHNSPNIDKLTALSLICKNFGYSLDVEDTNNLKDSINKLVSDIKGKPEENMIETLITRCMSKATYTIKNAGHYGLGFTHYSHFTSPIRRYPDLIVHRILLDYLNKKPNGNPKKIEDAAKWCSEREVLAARAERDSIKFKQIEYLEDKIGQVFDGMVSGVTDWGMYVELIESKCEGMVRYEKLYKVDTENYIVYTKTGESIRLGDNVKVLVKSVDLERKQIDFEIF
jgi:ribonuclease R